MKKNLLIALFIACCFFSINSSALLPLQAAERLSQNPATAVFTTHKQLSPISFPIKSSDQKNFFRQTAVFSSNACSNAELAHPERSSITFTSSTSKQINVANMERVLKDHFLHLHPSHYFL